MNSVTRCQSASRLITQASRLVSHSAIQSVRQSVGQLVGLPVSRSFGRLRHHRGRSPMAVFLTASRFRQAKHIHVYLYATKALPSRSAHIHAHQHSSYTHARARLPHPLSGQPEALGNKSAVKLSAVVNSQHFHYCKEYPTLISSSLPPKGAYSATAKGAKGPLQPKAKTNK